MVLGDNLLKVSFKSQVLPRDFKVVTESKGSVNGRKRKLLIWLYGKIRKKKVAG